MKETADYFLAGISVFEKHLLKAFAFLYSHPHPSVKPGTLKYTTSTRAEQNIDEAKKEKRVEAWMSFKPVYVENNKWH